MTKIVAISDTHFQESNIKIPECDILIHAGDFDIRTLDHLEQLNGVFYKWKQKAKKIIVIGGNHDLYLEKLNYHSICDILNNCYYLFNNSIEINGLKIWGSPFTNLFCNWVFMLPENNLAKIWAKIPNDTDIVITHGPPNRILDSTDIGNHNTGSFSLRNKIKEIKPRYHIFGHIHECFGKYTDYNTDYINASQMTSTYKLENEPIVLEI